MTEQVTVQGKDVILSPRIFQDLLEEQQSPCVSLYFPTHPAGPHIDQDSIRLQNLLREAETHLVSQGFRKPDVQTWLSPGMRLLEDRFFWEHQEAGLVLFFSPRAFQLYRLPLSVPEIVFVGQRFYFKPLFPLFSGDGEFYVLVLNQKSRQLYKCTRYTIHEMALDEVPGSLEEALAFDDPERQLQFHTGAPKTGDGRAAVFHGQGTGIDENKDRIRRYFQQVEAGVFRLLRDQHAPLILAAVDHYHHLYHEVNSYPSLLKEGIRKNPDALSSSQLHKEAWALVQPRFEHAIDDAKARYQELAGTGRTSTDMPEIVLAACQGRIETLFLVGTAQQWGVVDQAENRVELHPEMRPESEELLDWSAIQTLMKSGRIYSLSQEDMPEREPVAAIFRY